MAGRHKRVAHMHTPEDIKRAYRHAAQRRFDTTGLPRGLRTW